MLGRFQFHPALPLFLAALATACAGRPLPEEHRAVPPPKLQVQSAPPPVGRAASSLADVAGEWDIISFDGHSPARPDSEGNRRAFVDIDEQGLRFSINCNYFQLPAQIRSGVLHRAAGWSRGTQMGCGPEREARDETLSKFFDSGPWVAFLPDGRLRMTTPGHELLLERAFTSARDRPYLAVDQAPRTAFPQAAFRGSLAVANGCMVLRQKGSDLVVTPIFPRGTRLASGTLGQRELVFRDKQVALGTQYVFGGGFILASDFGSVLEAPIPAACPAQHYIVGTAEPE